MEIIILGLLALLIICGLTIARNNKLQQKLDSYYDLEKATKEYCDNCPSCGGMGGSSSIATGGDFNLDDLLNGKFDYCPDCGKFKNALSQIKK